MKNILSVNFRLARPEAFPGKGDKYLPKIIQDLSNLLRKHKKISIMIRFAFLRIK
jgi:hypothetical protein